MPARLSPPRILVVDDVADILSLYRILLSADAYEVVVAADGGEALRQAAVEPDLVLLDLVIPPPDGFEVARELRARYPDLPIVVVTALTQPALLARARACGASEVVTKPFDPEELLGRVRAWLARRAERTLPPPASSGG